MIKKFKANELLTTKNLRALEILQPGEFVKAEERGWKTIRMLYSGSQFVDYEDGEVSILRTGQRR